MKPDLQKPDLQKAVSSASSHHMKRGKASLAMGVFSLSIIVLGGSIFLPAGGANAQSQQLPEGPGKALATANCGSCHGLELVTAQRRSAEEWEEVVNRMIANGDTLNEEQYAEVIAYLGTYLGSETVSSAAPVGNGAVPVVPSAHGSKSS